MSYFNFLLVFILPILLIEIALIFIIRSPLRSYAVKGTLILAVVALLYTTPWDNYLVKSGIWTYPPDRVLGRIGYVPIEEYLFFILQSLVTGFWFYLVQFKFEVETVENSSTHSSTYSKIGLTVCAGLFLLGLAAIWIPNLQYASLILVWSVPVLTLQWLVGGKCLASNSRVLAMAVIPPTLYLWLADAYAIRDGIWSISESATCGIAAYGLPIEEAAFFFVTNLMLGQGLVLFLGMRNQFAMIYRKLNLEEIK